MKTGSVMKMHVLSVLPWGVMRTTSTENLFSVFHCIVCLYVMVARVKFRAVSLQQPPPPLAFIVNYVPSSWDGIIGRYQNCGLPHRHCGR